MSVRPTMRSMNLWMLATASIFVLAVQVDVRAQGAPRRLFEDAPGARGATHAPGLTPLRARAVRVHTDVLSGAEDVLLNLFPAVELTARRTSVSHPRAGSLLWHGIVTGGVQPGSVTLSVVNGTMAGTVFVDGRVFEIGFAGDAHEVREVNPASFPTEDPPLDAPQVGDTTTTTTSTTTTVAADAGTPISVLVVWTPAARMAAGGTTAAIQSVINLGIANGNTAYTNSGVAAQLQVVYSAEVAFTETSISNDLTSLRGTTDGVLDQVHTLRNQYAADVVSLIGSGYASQGACGIGYIMQSVSTSFAPYAFNVVDQSCAGGNMSLAHEVGHNEGLNHDPGNSSSTGAYSYAYGYQDPGGRFRTVMSYGGATRIPYFSSPFTFYNGVPTGTSTQNNAQALVNTVGTVANFRTTGTVAPPACTYSVSPTSLSFTAAGGTTQVAVTAGSGCAWNTVDPLTWVAVGPGGSGVGYVTVDVLANTGSKNRSGSVSVAGLNVSVSQRGARGK